MSKKGQKKKEPHRHHLISQVYMRGWGFGKGNNTLFIQERKDMEGSFHPPKMRKMENLTVKKDYYARPPDSQACTDNERKDFFKPLGNYVVRYEGRILESDIELAACFPYIDKWGISDSNGNIVNNAKIKEEIYLKQQEIRQFIENGWNTQYETKWHQARLELKNQILDSKESSIIAFEKDYLMRFLLSFDWRSSKSNSLYTDHKRRAINEKKSILFDENLSVSLRLQIYAEDCLKTSQEASKRGDDYFSSFFKDLSQEYYGQSESDDEEKKLNLLKEILDSLTSDDVVEKPPLHAFADFLNNKGMLWETYKKHMNMLTFSFYVATGTEHFISSDNPAFLSEATMPGNSFFIYYFPICPEIMLKSQVATSENLNKYSIERIEDEKVQEFNELIKANCDKFIILPPEKGIYRERNTPV